MKVLTVMVARVVPRISALGTPLLRPSCAMAVAIADKKMRPTS